MEKTRISCTHDLDLYTRTFTQCHLNTNVFSFAHSKYNTKRLVELL
jgi:hypothetical protein